MKLSLHSLISSIAFGSTVFIASMSLPAVAATDSSTWSGDEDVIGYDVIVQDLNRESHQAASAAGSSRARASRAFNDPFESIWIHGGVGFTSSMQTLSFEDGNSIYLNHKGIQASLGIDLFSENWMAEGVVRSFGDAEGGGSQVSLKEFELKIDYKDRFSRQLGYHAGGGLTGRYMTVHRASDSLEYTTPTSVATLGLDLFLSDKVSLGAEVSARNSLIAETIDKNSYDASVRLDAHF
jgi:hypothetical protein